MSIPLIFELGYVRGNTTQQTRHVETMMFECWASVAEVGLTLKHLCFSVSYLLGTCILVVVTLSAQGPNLHV